MASRVSDLQQWMSLLSGHRLSWGQSLRSGETQHCLYFSTSKIWGIPNFCIFWHSHLNQFDGHILNHNSQKNKQINWIKLIWHSKTFKTWAGLQPNPKHPNKTFGLKVTENTKVTTEILIKRTISHNSDWFCLNSVWRWSDRNQTYQSKYVWST